MAESEFYMQCEEEELAPCQSNMEEVDQTENINTVHNGHAAVSLESSVSPAPTVQPPAIKTAHMPVASSSPVQRPLLANVLQITKGQPIYIAPKPYAGTQQSIATPVSYFLPTGQAVTFLTPTQASSLISPQLASLSSTTQPAAFQIPVTVIHNSSAVQTVTTVTSSGMPAVGTSPSTSLPHTSPVVSELPSTSCSTPTLPPADDNQERTSPANNVLAPGNTKTSSQVSSVKTRGRTRKSVLSAISTKVFQNVLKVPQFCHHCNVAYKVVHELRGYMCHCNPELINSVHALTSKPRRRVKRTKRSSDPKKSIPYMHKSTISPSVSFSTSVSNRHPAASPPPFPSSPPPPPPFPSSPSPPPPPPTPCLKHITTSEIPEGVNSPGTGDFDEHGKLIMLVEDFYYGTAPGQPVLIENNQMAITMKCHLCDKKLKNNIKLMNHMKHHMEMEQQRGDGESHTMCQHCFRNFDTPFSLQCHLETVHSQIESASLCKICELSYENTPLFLHHMKNFHKPGEMPYMCQVCNFRSSFYNDVIIHFRELHKDTVNLLCPYCLKVFKSCNSYQLHYNKHQKKSVLHCNKCRLQFLYAKDKTEHKFSFHQTHLKPVQLLGLQPGTKITIRAYSVTKVNDSTKFSKPSMNSESSSVSTVPAPQSVVKRITPTKRKPVESILDVMTKFQRRCELSRTWFCIECNFEIPDFSRHFPTFVHCSLCRYSTCCSRAYANHMISNHVPRKTTTKYLNLYKPCPKLGKLSCKTCDYSSEIGDLMATHLTKNPSHTASHCEFNEGFARGYERFVFIPSDLIRKGQAIIIQQQERQVDQNSLPEDNNCVPLQIHCIKPPDSSAHNTSIPSEVQPVVESTVPDEDCGTQPKELTQQKLKLPGRAQTQAAATAGGSLTVAQLKIVLHALCYGVPQAASQFDSQPDEVQCLILKRQLELGPPKSREGLIPRASDQLAEWVLCHREQQFPVDEVSLFSKAAKFMSADGGPGISYGWAVDFLINHDLSLQSLATSQRLLPHKVQERLHAFISFINKQVTSHCLGLSAIAAMDELSIFIDMEQLDPASADSSSMMSAFKLVGEKDPLLDIVLASLADGTILPTVVFLSGEPLSPDAPTLPDIIMEAKPEGFSDEERLQLWFDKVWHRHMKNSGGNSLLVVDQYRGHLSQKFQKLLSSANTLPGIIPHACSCRVQPLEACVGLVLREFLQARWTQHVTESPQDLIGALPADLALLFSAWLLEMLDVLAERPEFLQRSFEPVLHSNTELEPQGYSELVQNLTEVLLLSTIQEEESNEPKAGEKSNMSSAISPSLLPSPSNPQTLKKIFEEDKNLDTFHGFDDAEIMNSTKS